MYGAGTVAHVGATPEFPQYQPGSVDDFDRLYRDSYARVLRTLRSILREPTAAEECAQEAFMRAFRAWPRWRPDAPAEAWVHRIALNVATSYRRREGLRSLGYALRHLGRTAGATAPPDPSTSAELLHALRRLPAKQAAVIVLRHYRGYTNREIAGALGVAESTIASRLAAAKKQLRRELGGDERVTGSDEHPMVEPSR
jgi:RNA polymerase sigma-70 factor (ECF subfamily)